MTPCGCKHVCGDDGDTEGPGTCKGLPRAKRIPIVEVVLVPRWPVTPQAGIMGADPDRDDGHTMGHTE